jgi:pimeloyl-ACP methyl ester carboxylesterase
MMRRKDRYQPDAASASQPKTLKTYACARASGDPIRGAGHTVYTPTIKGNRLGDPKTIGLDEAIQSIVNYLNENDLKDAILIGHSYGGMIITGAADRASDRVRRLVYWNAFVQNNGEFRAPRPTRNSVRTGSGHSTTRIQCKVQ